MRMRAIMYVVFCCQVVVGFALLTVISCTCRYKDNHETEISTPAFAQLLSNTLYMRRLFPYYTFNVVGGMHLFLLFCGLRLIAFDVKLFLYVQGSTRKEKELSTRMMRWEVMNEYSVHAKEPVLSI